MYEYSYIHKHDNLYILFAHIMLYNNQQYNSLDNDRSSRLQADFQFHRTVQKQDNPDNYFYFAILYFRLWPNTPNTHHHLPKSEL